jgi:hypothetical protein
MPNGITSGSPTIRDSVFAGRVPHCGPCERDIRKILPGERKSGVPNESAIEAEKIGNSVLQQLRATYPVLSPAKCAHPGLLISMVQLVVWHEHRYELFDFGVRGPGLSYWLA